MKRRWIPIALLFLLILAMDRDARAWSPGPYRFEDCVQKFDTAVRGRVSRVEAVDRKPGGWVLSRASIDVERAYHGIPGDAKTLTFYFWSSTDNVLTLAHSLSVKDRILVFLSTQLDGLAGLKTDNVTRHQLQFAKANHRGYLYKIVREGGVDQLQDAIFAKDPQLAQPLTAAEVMLAQRPR